MKDIKSNIKFTVIVPTRERSDTLKWSLKTCVEQDYADFEIIVSDNFSQDDTREVVESFKDNRIRYINTGKRRSMSGNYEFALSHVTGEYVCIIGDDDGIMPNALSELNKILRGTKIEAISWKKPVYIWNEHSTQELKNTLQTTWNRKFRKYDAAKIVTELLEFKPGSRLTFNNLACLYHGFVKVETINKLRLPDGRFFNSLAPDVYASLVISCTVRNLYETAVPYTMHGISKHSTGFSSQNLQGLKKFISEDNIPSHPSIKMCPISAPICIADCFLKIHDDFPAAAKFEMDIKAVTRKAMEEAVTLTAENYQLTVDSVKSICAVYDIREHGEQIIAQNPNLTDKNPVIFGYNFMSSYFVLKFGDEVKNIYDATLKYQKLLEKNLFGFYILESNRFLWSSVKSRGIKNSVGKGLRRLSSKFGFAS